MPATIVRLTDLVRAATLGQGGGRKTERGVVACREQPELRARSPLGNGRAGAAGRPPARLVTRRIGLEGDGDALAGDVEAADTVVRVALSKIPSKIAKFRLQIVENRLQFQSKISPASP